MKYSKWHWKGKSESGNDADREKKVHMEACNVFICVAELKSDLNVNQSYAEYDIC